MKRNMGSADRLIRLLAAAVIAVLYFTGQITGLAAILLLVIGVVFVLTSSVGCCPLYSIMHFKTNKKETT